MVAASGEEKRAFRGKILCVRGIRCELTGWLLYRKGSGKG